MERNSVERSGGGVGRLMIWSEASLAVKRVAIERGLHRLPASLP